MSAEWKFLITLNEQLRPLKDPAAIMETAVRLLGQHLGASRVHYAAIEGDEFVIRRYYTDGVKPLPTRAPLSIFSESIVAACQKGETVVVDDFRTDERFTDEERERFLSHNIAALVGAADQGRSMAVVLRRTAPRRGTGRRSIVHWWRSRRTDVVRQESASARKRRWAGAKAGRRSCGG